MEKFTEQQIKNWKAFEKVRQSGKYNMFGARHVVGLSMEDYSFVMHNFEALKAQAEGGNA